MSSRMDDILHQLDQTRHTLRSVLDHLQIDDWEKTIQDEDQKWTVRQIVSHLFDAQRGMTGQISKISVGEEVIPPDFDLNRWNRRAVEKQADKTPQELVAGLEDGRTALKQVLNGLTDEQLDKRGRHSSLQIMSVEEIIRQIATHEADHARIIAEKLGLSSQIG
jgi:uncharacterized damage-inducible protein DinB